MLLVPFNKCLLQVPCGGEGDQPEHPRCLGQHPTVRPHLFLVAFVYIFIVNLGTTLACAATSPWSTTSCRRAPAATLRPSTASAASTARSRGRSSKCHAQTWTKCQGGIFCFFFACALQIGPHAIQGGVVQRPPPRAFPGVHAKVVRGRPRR